MVKLKIQPLALLQKGTGIRIVEYFLFGGIIFGLMQACVGQIEGVRTKPLKNKHGFCKAFGQPDKHISGGQLVLGFFDIRLACDSNHLMIVNIFDLHIFFKRYITALALPAALHLLVMGKTALQGFAHKGKILNGGGQMRRGVDQGVSGYAVKAEEKDFLHKTKIGIRKNVVAHQRLEIAMPQKG